MESLKTVFYLGFIFVLPFLFKLPRLITKILTNIKFQRKLKKITPALNSIDLKKIQQAFLANKNEFQILQRDLGMVFKIKSEMLKHNTVDDFIKKIEKQKVQTGKKKNQAAEDIKLNNRRY